LADSTRHLTFGEVHALLLARSIPEPNSGCLLWEGSIVRQKPGKRAIYGNIRLHGKMVKTHRVAYEATFGPIPAGAHVLHRCDVGLCCNPDHLFLGDNESNIADKVTKDRGRKKLTIEQAREIHMLYREGVRVGELARRFSLDQGYVSNLLSGKRRPAALASNQEYV
jgi:hypothetical protein